MDQRQEGSGKTRDEIAEAYASPPWWYDARGFLILTFAYNSSLGAQLRFFGPNFGDSHIEVACGTGTLLELLLRWRKWKRLPQGHVIGIDYAESMLAGARHRFRGSGEVEVRHADAADMPFPDETFDTANIANSIHCFPDVDSALREVHRVLKPGGTLATNVLLYPRTPWPLGQIAERINRWGMKKGILYRPYGREEIRQKYQESGFEIVSERIHGNCYDVLLRKAKDIGQAT